MTAEERVLDLLTREFSRLQTHNPSFSLRAFARRLDIVPSLLSDLMRGKCRVTRKTGEKVLAHLGGNPDEIRELLSELKARTNDPRPGSPKKTSSSVQTYKTLDMEQFHLIAEWEHFAVFCLSMTRGFDPNPKAVGRALGIGARKAKSVLDRLLRLGILKKSPNGEVQATTKNIQTTTDIPNVYLRRQHIQNLDLVRRSMLEDEFDRCDYSSITLAIDPSRIPEAKKRIREFRHSMGEFLEAGNQTEVARLSIQFFPLSHRKKSKRKEDKNASL